MTADITAAQAKWTATLGELALQMTRATFDTWLRGSRVVARDNGTLTVQVRHEYAVDWLQNRLMPTIQRTADRHFPEGTTIRFTAGETPASLPDDQTPPLEGGAGGGEDDDAQGYADIDLITDPALAAFDVEVAGWSKLHNYATDFWAELLGPAAFLTWLAIKSEDIRRNKTPLTPAMRFSVSRLARIAAGGNTQSITGVWRTCRSRSILEHGQPCQHCQERDGQITTGADGRPTCRYWRPGAFDILQKEGIALVRRLGEGLQTSYRIKVFNALPLLTPAQALRLHPVTQEIHDRWLRRQDLDADNWERLTVATLALPEWET